MSASAIVYLPEANPSTSRADNKLDCYLKQKKKMYDCDLISCYVFPPVYLSEIDNLLVIKQDLLRSPAIYCLLLTLGGCISPLS